MKNHSQDHVQNNDEEYKKILKRARRAVGGLLISAVAVSAMCIGVAAADSGVTPISDTTTAVSENYKAPANISETLSYGLNVIAASDELVFSGLVGNEITFEANDIKRAMNLSELNFITVTKLPPASVGTLYVGSVGVSEGQTITAGNMSLLSFAAADESKPSSAYMEISVNGSAYVMKCKMCLIDNINYTPTLSLAPSISLSVMTYRDTPMQGCLSAYDPEGDTMTYEIVKYASHGRVTMDDKHTGAYTYTPDKGFSGEDSFVYVVRDEYGNYSTSLTVNMRVDNPPAAFTYSDIEGSAYASSAIRVTAAGIMNGTQVGGECYFKPDMEISRVEFLVTAMNAAKIQASDATQYKSTGFYDDADIPNSMKCYVALAKERGYISGKSIDGNLCFAPNESISRAEAAVILSNIIGYANNKTVTTFADADEIPTWAGDALRSLRSLGILSARDGEANASVKMTRGATAAWLCSTMQLMGN